MRYVLNLLEIKNYPDGWPHCLRKKENRCHLQRCEVFLYRCGSDMYTLKNELEKLISYVGEREEITIRDLEELTSSQTTNQIFVDA